MRVECEEVGNWRADTVTFNEGQARGDSGPWELSSMKDFVTTLYTHLQTKNLRFRKVGGAENER